MDDNIYDKLQNVAKLFSNNFSTIDEPIDMKLQTAYFMRSKKVKEALKDAKPDIDQIADLYDPSLTDEQLMERMILLSDIDDPRAYRILEEYAQNRDNRLHQWSLMAQQESKMLIEGSLLNERQIFVSTGLGGRGHQLRYFVGLIANDIAEFEPYQQHIIQTEFDSALKANNSELEHIEFQGPYAALTLLIPLDVPFHKVLLSAVEECNQYGNFLKEDFLVTNVRMLTFADMDEIVKKRESDGDSDDEGGIGSIFDDIEGETE